ncbi:hypothetical protein D3230_09635 [Leucobacter chromiireducens subsp. solipictus]|uniref:DksA C4-type domain-containing protein n=2 Tax=Leucobacter TaxID=55968 RepID=A0ABS1SHP2_9MICO|nr:hypothetical protein [Leucobacter chromiireducens subsp. solipictus]
MYSYEQVKEKFGALRCYASISSDLPEDTRGQMHAAILDAENRSLTICEECSHRGKLRNETWQRTLCDACFQESNARHRSQQ